MVTHILKKRCLDRNDFNKYRPVSNLCFIAKIQEKLVLSQVSSYLNKHNLYTTCQSAYRPGHSTETALLKVVNDLFLSLNKGNISVLALPEFSSAFDKTSTTCKHYYECKCPNISMSTASFCIYSLIPDKYSNCHTCICFCFVKNRLL